MGEVIKDIGAGIGGLYLIFVYGGAFVLCLLFVFGWFEDLARYTERKLWDDNWWGTKFLRWYFKLPRGLRKTFRFIWKSITVGIGIAIFIWGVFKYND